MNALPLWVAAEASMSGISLSSGTARRQSAGQKKPTLTARIGVGEDAREITVPGRFAWTLNELVKAGAMGCTPIERPAPRWSHYVWRLRHDWGVAIETINESHGGPYAGSHARYVLRCPVQIIEGALP